MFRLATEPQSIGKVLDSGLRLFTGSFAGVIAFAFIASLLGVVPSVVAELILAQAITTESIGLGTMIATYLVFLFLSVALYGAILVRMGGLAAGKAMTFGQAFAIGVRRIPKLSLVGLLYVLVVLLGTVALVIPGIVLGLTLYFAVPAALLDNEGITESLSRSHRLVWGNWWRTATVMSVPFVIYLALYIGLFTIFGTMVALSGEVSGNVSAMVVLYGGQIIVTAAGLPLIYAVTITQYHDLKLRKEGADLAARIETVAGR